MTCLGPTRIDDPGLMTQSVTSVTQSDTAVTKADTS